MSSMICAKCGYRFPDIGASKERCPECGMGHYLRMLPRINDYYQRRSHFRILDSVNDILTSNRRIPPVPHTVNIEPGLQANESAEDANPDVRPKPESDAIEESPV